MFYYINKCSTIFYSLFWPVTILFIVNTLFSDVIINVFDIDTRASIMENSTVAINGTVTAKNFFTYRFVSCLLSYQYQLAHNATYVIVTKQLVIRTRAFIALSVCISQTGENSLYRRFVYCLVPNIYHNVSQHIDTCH